MIVWQIAQLSPRVFVVYRQSYGTGQCTKNGKVLYQYTRLTLEIKGTWGEITKWLEQYGTTGGQPK